MAERATTAARGYGTDHQRERARWQRRLNGGKRVTCSCLGACARHTGPCTVVIDKHTPPDQWDLGHNEGQQGYAGPQDVPCNRGAGAINSHRAKLTVREW